MPSFPKLLSSLGFNVTTVPPNNQLRVMVKNSSGRFEILSDRKWP